MEGALVLARSTFPGVWSRICALAGEDFETITGKSFIYHILGDYLYPSRTNYAIHKTDFQTVYRMVPIDGPGQISNMVRGLAYIWAVMHDQRISKGEW